MQSNRLFLLYLVLALLALGLTWVHVPYYLGAGFVQANIRFWQDALLNANPAGVFFDRGYTVSRIGGQYLDGD